MIQYVPSLERLVNELAKLPGVGPKTAQRLAYYILRSPAAYNDNLRAALENVKAVVHECPRCFSFTENDGLCHYCVDPSRVNDSICVVEDPADISRIDSSGAFRGRYLAWSSSTFRWHRPQGHPPRSTFGSGYEREHPRSDFGAGCRPGR